jgi:hypothetical protein
MRCAARRVVESFLCFASFLLLSALALADELTLTPKQLDAEHRSFYADEDNEIHADEQGPATDKSPVVK